ncbi:S49 family peptidase [Burkholderia stagnalis]|uniref:S49 family peptidase n=1 Tax=Burkholderia stagnalis TaxID=1503054 RepID=UPI0021AB66D6|nr:S49 family peptidase [Burkholderia stagnalis]
MYTFTTRGTLCNTPSPKCYLPRGAILPNRLPFVRAALANGARGQIAPQDAAHQVRTYAATNAVPRHLADNGAIAVLPFHGISVQRTDALGEAFGLLSLARFTQTFLAALASDAVGGILIDVDSPGGSVYGIAELVDEIFRARARKPVFAVANSLAASGAYWIGSAASEFYVTPGGEVGSIGVVTAHEDFSKALGKAGIQTTLIAAGKYKTEGNPFGPLGMDARRHVQERVNDYYRMFVGAVAKHRNVAESAVRNGMGQGRLLDGQRAKRETMVDGVATFDDVVGRLAQRISAGRTGTTSLRTNPLHARQRVTDAVGRAPSDKRLPAMNTAVHERVIELLSL